MKYERHIVVVGLRSILFSEEERDRIKIIRDEKGRVKKVVIE